MMEKVRELIRRHSGLPAEIEIADDTDLYRAGMKSFASVQLMLALEGAFAIEFPEDMLKRTTFRTANAIAAAIRTLPTGGAASEAARGTAGPSFGAADDV